MARGRATSATQVPFLQHVIDSLKPGGRCGIVLDEGHRAAELRGRL